MGLSMNLDDATVQRKLNVSPRLGKVSYGAAELKRLYNKHLSIGLVISTLITWAFCGSLWFLVEKEQLKNNERVVRILNYTEIQLPRPLGEVEFGLSAYPVLSSDKSAGYGGGDGSALMPGSRPGKGKGGFPAERRGEESLERPPGLVGMEKMNMDEEMSERHFFGNENAAPGHNDIPGGSGQSDEPWRKGGTPMPGSKGEPPSGVDISGVGASSKPSAGNAAYGLGGSYDEEGDGVGGGGFSMNWGQGLVRRRLSGELPVYPYGSNISAQVRLLATVSADGSVKSIQVMEKADRSLEEAAIKAVKTWKFEPLSKDMPQIDQSCIITFYFKLK